ncbi:NAD(P)-dependent oxidoreductase [Synechococcus sp. AH-736-G20]|nr:NAD(P)-dependent oxidoreductase [Synechococcus sp. AH-736-G20]
MKLLLTGGTGFFGRALLRRFLSLDAGLFDKIYVISRNPSAFLAAYPEFSCYSLFTFLKSDICDRKSLPWDLCFTHVLHAATDSTKGSCLTPLQLYDQIVNGTRNVLDLAVATGANRFLLTSSGAVYGSQPPELAAISEDWSGGPPLDDPHTAYGHAKRAAEHLCVLVAEQYGLDVVIARCFAFVGADLPLDVHFAIGNFIRDALLSQAITVAGDGTPVRTYLDQQDLAHWLLTLLQSGHPLHTYNVGSDEEITIADLAYLVRDLLAPTKSVHILGDPVPGALRNRYVPDIRKANRHLGLGVTITLADAIRSSGAAAHAAMGMNS